MPCMRTRRVTCARGGRSFGGATCRSRPAWPSAQWAPLPRGSLEGELIDRGGDGRAGLEGGELEDVGPRRELLVLRHQRGDVDRVERWRARVALVEIGR